MKPDICLDALKPNPMMKNHHFDVKFNGVMQGDNFANATALF